jgi:hypothetical protein
LKGQPHRRLGNLDIDLAKERKMRTWVRLSFDLPPDTDLSGLLLAQDPRLYAAQL